MNMTMMNIKSGRKKWGILFVLSLFSFSLIYYRTTPPPKRAELEVFETADGWGYQIRVDSKVLIYQPTIPALSSNRSFPNEDSARETGLFVMKKVKAGKEFSVTEDEVNRILAQTCPSGI